MSNPRCLALFLEAPWKLNGGALIRNYWLADALRKRYDVDMVVAEDPMLAAPDEFKSRFASITCFPNPIGLAAKLRRAGALFNPASSYFTGGQVTRDATTFVHRRLRDGGYRVVHVGDLNQSEALPAHSDTAIWYDAHNCESALVRRQVQFEHGPLKAFVLLDAVRVRGVEGRLVHRSRHISACSAADVSDLAEIDASIMSKHTIVPNGVDVAGCAAIRAADSKPGCIMLGGYLDWRPTGQGMWWFVNEVLPLLPEAVDGVELEIRIAGRMGPKLVDALSKIDRLVLSPNPPVMAPELTRADIIAVPVLASSGSRLRILEAWASGRPVVTTPSGALGLTYDNGRELFAYESATEFAESIVRLVRDRAAWRELRANGLARAEDYDWPRLGDRLLAAHAAVFGE
jgi:glycosyltransferase involved in cell wall biosynthesis